MTPPLSTPILDSLLAAPWLVSLAVAGAAGIALRRSRAAKDRWERLASIAAQSQPLTETANGLLAFLSTEIQAPGWALYRYEKSRQHFDLVATLEGEGPRALRPAPVSLDAEPESAPGVPTSVPYHAPVTPGVSLERGLQVLTFPLGPPDAPVGLVKAFPIPEGVLPATAASLIGEMQQRLGEILIAAGEREQRRTRLAELESSSQVREALLASTFNVQRLVENTLGIVLLSTRSSGVLVRLGSGTESVPGASRTGPQVFYAGDAEQVSRANPGQWQQVEASLTSGTGETCAVSRSGDAGDLLGSLEVDQALAVPVQAGQGRIGSLMVTRRGEQAFGEGEARLARAFATQLGRVWQNERAYQMAEDTYRETLRMLIELMDGRQPQSAGHSTRVMNWSLLTGKVMGLAETEMETLRWAALLHDVGMCGIGEDVLKTRGRLPEDERDRIRQHPRLGSLICAPLQYPQPVSPGILSHHERWDGRGYPDGTAGENIPLHGRIIAVAEVFNALVSPRNYREGRSFSSAIQEIQEQSGLAFDPAVVKAFLKGVESESHPVL